MHRGAAGASFRSSRDLRIGVATFNVTDVGNERSIRCLQADPLIEIADQILEHGDPEFLSVGDGIVTFHCSNADVSYGLREHDDLRETWLGVRSDVDEDELASPDQGDAA